MGDLDFGSSHSWLLSCHSLLNPTGFPQSIAFSLLLHAASLLYFTASISLLSTRICNGRRLDSRNFLFVLVFCQT
ncbi:hypothetical protein C8J57DRAFT_1114128 [Mycena rebaudengoi]|nr:hypothetical protein C8J57DRAFT_1114128 [Mycena rebaudengoi]